MTDSDNCLDADSWQHSDASLLQKWEEFKRNYDKLGYRVGSYGYFNKWLQQGNTGKEFDDPKELQRRIHAYRKRLRLQRRRDQG